MRSRAAALFLAFASALAAGGANFSNEDLNINESAASAPAPLDFQRQILPILTKVGCNSGQCHGAAGGQGGFSLSLRGYDAEADYDSIVRERAGRRVDFTNPEHSLILRKPSKHLPHRGGKKLPDDSKYYEEVRRWIEAGAPFDRDPARAAVLLEVSPAESISVITPRFPLTVTVKLADGTALNVTDTVLFTSGDESVARVNPDGIVEVVGSGETAILVKFLNLVTAARVGAPFGCDVSEMNYRGASGKKLMTMRLLASPTLVDGGERLVKYRRAYLNIAGVLPDVGDARRLHNGDIPDFYDELLKSPAVIVRWTRWLADLLRVREESMGRDGARRAQEYLKLKLESKTPLDQIVREIITSKGTPWEKGPAAFSLATEGPAAQMEFVTKTFMGARFQCAQCHQHPFDRWSREDYFGLAAFFSRVRRENGKVVLTDSGDFTDPKSGKPARPRFPAEAGSVNATYPEIPPGVDRREIFCNWLLDKDRKQFDRVIVNRIWKELYGVGIVDPVDDFRAGNPPSNPQLLDELVKDFESQGRDLMSFVIRCEVYNNSSADPMPGTERDFRYYSHAYIKPLSGPVLLDAVAKACGYTLKFGDRERYKNAQEIPDEDGGNVSIRSLGRCPRDGSADPSVVPPPSLATALHWINGPFAKEMIDAPGGRVEKIVNSKCSIDEATDELFLATLTRFPNDDERVKAKKSLGSKLTKENVGDLLWALLATSEFATNH